MRQRRGAAGGGFGHAKKSGNSPLPHSTWLLFALAFFLTGCASGAGGVSAANMEPGPLWVSKAAWDAAGERVVIADPGSGAIYVYDTKGRIRRRIADESGEDELDFPRPNYASRIGSRYLIATSSNRWIWFDGDLVARSPWDLEWEEEGVPYASVDASEFDFSDTHAYAIGSGRTAAGEWSERGVFAVSLQDRSVEHIGRIGVDEETTNYYREPPFNLAVCGGSAWLLDMTSPLSIREARDGGKVLRSFPDEFRQRPEIPVLVCASSLAARNAALRDATIAAGLFCTGRRLLLLAHKPRPAGGLQWLVYPIDPARDVMEPPIELPTSADEIVFVPGPKRWAVLEKGAMQHIGSQPLTRIISFPRPK